MSEEIRVIGAEEAPVVYSDSIDLGHSLYDFRLSIRQNLQLNVYREIFQLRLAPSHFKRLTLLMMEHLARYEHKYGEIPSIPQEDA